MGCVDVSTGIGGGDVECKCIATNCAVLGVVVVPDEFDPDDDVDDNDVDGEKR